MSKSDRPPNDKVGRRSGPKTGATAGKSKSDSTGADNSPDTDGMHEAANEFLQLWQDHLRQMAHDPSWPKLTDMVTPFMTVMLNHQTQNPFAFNQAHGSQQKQPHKNDGKTPDSQTPDSKTSGTASDDVGAFISECRARLAALELRLTHLEGQLTPSGSPPEAED